jgi:hypothetical protein
LNFVAGLRQRVAMEKWKCGFGRIVRSQALLIIIFSFVPAALAEEVRRPRPMATLQAVSGMIAGSRAPI